MQSKKGIIHFLPLILVTGLIIIVISGFFYFEKRPNSVPLITRCCDEGENPHEPEINKWQTYTDNKYSYKFDYHNDYTVSVDDNVVSLKKELPSKGDGDVFSGVSIRFISKTKSGSLVEYAQNLEKEEYSDGIATINQIGASKFNNYNAYKYQISALSNFEVTLIENPYDISQFVEVTLNGEYDKSVEDEIISQIFSSFEFVESDNTIDNWQRYTNDIFSVSYPSDVTLRDDPSPYDINLEGITLVKLGSTQSRGTEVYDGFIINFFPLKKTDDISLKDFVNLIVDQTNEIGQVLEQPKKINLNNYDAYRIVTSGLGEFEGIFVENADYIIHISILINADPQRVGYEKIIDEILSTFKFTN